MRTAELKKHLETHWEKIRAKLLAGTYVPTPVRRKEIEKPGGGVRTLGIPTVLDRFIQQLLLQVMTPIREPLFSDHSYGFRPGRSAADAVRTAQEYRGMECFVPCKTRGESSHCSPSSARKSKKR
jgi:retron-type reverse transcriptase